MKVYLQYKYGAKDSPQFQYLLKNPPKGIEYLNWKRGNDVTTTSTTLQKQNINKKNIRSFISNNNLPIPNISFVTSRFKFDVIHAINTIPITNSPYIVEFEAFWQPFLCGVDNKFAAKIIKFLLKRKNCKSIVVWSKLSKQNLLKILGNDKVLSKKIHVVYPAVPIQTKKTKNDALTLGFVGRYFYEKGGDVALEVMKQCPKHRGVVVSDVPDNVVIPDNVTVLPLIDRKELLESVYPGIDIFVYPGFSDSFGFALLEAMSFGIPIVTVNGYSRTEIVVPNENGFVINSILDKWGQYSGANTNMRFVSRLVAAIAALTRDKKLLKKIGDTNFDCVDSGRFAIKKRNAKLLKLYKEAI